MAHGAVWILVNFPRSNVELRRPGLIHLCLGTKERWKRGYGRRPVPFAMVGNMEGAGPRRRLRRGGSKPRKQAKGSMSSDTRNGAKFNRPAS